MAPHQCVHCSKIYPDAAEELLKGCNCGSRFFYYIRQDWIDSKEKDDLQVKIEQLADVDKKQIEEDVREIMGVEQEEVPVILDLESIKVLKPGKYQIDIINMFNKKRPLIYKLEEGKYIIDLASTIKVSADQIEESMGDIKSEME